jgi:hypothetical protein
VKLFHAVGMIRPEFPAAEREAVLAALTITACEIMRAGVSPSIDDWRDLDELERAAFSRARTILQRELAEAITAALRPAPAPQSLEQLLEAATARAAAGPALVGP